MVEGKITYRVIASASPFRKGLIAKLSGIISLKIGFVQSVIHMLAQRPKAVIGFGGYPSLAPIVVGRLCRATCILHEQNAVMGRANRLLCKLAHHVALSFTPTKNCPDDVPLTHTGLPVRAAFEAITPYEVRAAKCHLVVIGGSLGAQIFSDILPSAIAQLPEAHKRNLVITQQARDEHIAMLSSAYASQGISAQVARFYHDIAYLYEQADIIISRAGASSVAEIAAAGRASILIPFAAAMDDHQTGNAANLAENSAALMISEQQATAQNLAAHLQDLIANHEKRTKIAHAAKAQSCSGNAQAIARLTGVNAPTQGAAL